MWGKKSRPLPPRRMAQSIIAVDGEKVSFTVWVSMTRYSLSDPGQVRTRLRLAEENAGLHTARWRCQSDTGQCVDFHSEPGLCCLFALGRMRGWMRGSTPRSISMEGVRPTANDPLREGRATKQSLGPVHRGRSVPTPLGINKPQT